MLEAVVHLARAAIERDELALFTLSKRAAVCVNFRFGLAVLVDVLAYSPVLLSLQARHWFHAHGADGNLIVTTVGCRAVVLNVRVMLRTKTKKMNDLDQHFSQI